MTLRKSAAMAALGMFALILGGAAADEPKSGGELVVGFFSDITGLDPTRNGGAAGDLTAVLFERLLVLRDDGSVAPALATDCAWLDDTTMRFTLRQGVTFHSGTAFDANAAKWNIDRLIDPDVGAIQFAFLSPIIKEARVVDDYTLDIELQGTNASWEKLVANHTVMLDPARVEELGDGFSALPSGTGAFMLEEWAPRQYVKMKRNPDWWDEGNYVETLRFDIIPELSTRVLALQAGDVHVLTNPTPDSLAQFESGGFQVASISSDRILKLDFNHQDPKWQNEALRRAVLLATDSEGIAEALIAPFGTPAQSIMTNVHESYVAEPGYLAHDPEAAMAALEEAGYARGSDGSWSMDEEALTIHIGVPPKRDLRNDDIAEALAADLQAIGIDVRLTVADWGSMWGMLNEPEIPFDMFYTGWGSLLDEVGTLSAHYYGPNMSPGGLNMSRRSGDPIDSLIATARVTVDDSERIAILQEVQREFFARSIALPIYDKTRVWILGPTVRGFSPFPTAAYPRQYIGTWLDE